MYLIRMGVRELQYTLGALFDRAVALYPTLLVCSTYIRQCARSNSNSVSVLLPTLVIRDAAGQSRRHQAPAATQQHLPFG
jgi:hypothetical protein